MTPAAPTLIDSFFMTPELALMMSLLLPLVGTILIGMSGDSRPNQREVVTFGTAFSLFAITLWLLGEVTAGEVPQLVWFDLLPGLPIAFKVEPLGMLFALVASGLWIINSIYSVGYMRGNGEQNQTRFFMCFPIAIMGALGIAYSANMLTLFLFYEVLTLSTYPLVAHKETEEAKRGARIYLGILLTTSIGFLLSAIIWTYVATGTLDFTQGGILAADFDPVLAPILLALYMFGIGKAALMPFHKWLPSAMVAPTPVSALLHAVAVVKAGVFTVLKVAVYIFGIDYLRDTGATNWLLWVAAFTLITASIIALTKDNLKARLAYSTVSQLSYIVLGVAMASTMGIMGGALQIAMHAVGKITLFFCAGAIYVATHKTEISQLNGLGRIMPFTFAAFFIASLSIIGLPPLGGSWSKFYLMMGAVEGDMIILLGVLIVSSLLNIAYLMPITIRGFLMSEPEWQSDQDRVSGQLTGPSNRFSWANVKEAPLYCVLPLCITAVGCVVLFFTAGSIVALIEPIL